MWTRPDPTRPVGRVNSGATLCGLGWAEGSMSYMGTYWRSLANTIEPSDCGGDAALCQVTLTIC